MSAYRKKLIEVALPLDAINEASAYDKMPGIGHHPKGIHHWWARLPLPSARAILFASLVDDPSSNPDFVNESEQAQRNERERLFKIIHALLQKKPHTCPEIFQQAFSEIERSCGANIPSVFDPFSGGGAIPLEALRLGIQSYAGDLNPIAILINKVYLEILPQYTNNPPINPQSGNNLILKDTWCQGQGLVNDVKYYSKLIEAEAKGRIGQLYTSDIKEGEVIAWLWARTVASPNPACNYAHVPLMTTFWLSNQKKKEIYLEPIVDRENNTYRFEIKYGKPANIAKIKSGTKTGKGSNFSCLFSGQPISRDYIQREALANRMSTRLIGIVVDTEHGRVYQSINSTQTCEGEHLPIVDEPTETLSEDRRAITPPDYGMTTIASLFSQRQLVAIATLSTLVKESQKKNL